MFLCHIEGHGTQSICHSGCSRKLMLINLVPLSKTDFFPCSTSTLRVHKHIYMNAKIDIVKQSNPESFNPKWTRKFRIHPKIWCLNFKPQYLLNYSSPSHDLQRVRKKTIRAFNLIFKLLGWGPASGFAVLAPDFAPKLCTHRVSGCISECVKTCEGHFDPILIPVG